MNEYWNLSKVSGKTGEDAVKYIVSVGTTELSEAAIKRTKTFSILYIIINVGVFFLN